MLNFEAYFDLFYPFWLHENGFYWKLVEGPEFKNFRIILDNVMKEWAKDNIDTTKRQAELISYDFENALWDRGFTW